MIMWGGLAFAGYLVTRSCSPRQRRYYAGPRLYAAGVAGLVCDRAPSAIPGPRIRTFGVRMLIAFVLFIRLRIFLCH